MNRSWRFTGTWPRMFGLIDTRSLFPILFAVMHLRVWTLKAVGVCVLVLAVALFFRFRVGVLIWACFFGVLRSAGYTAVKKRPL